MRPNYIIDFDSTLVTIETLDELIALSLADDPLRDEKVSEINKITDLGMTGQIAFDESLHRRLETVALTVGHVAQIIDMLARQLSPSALRNRTWFQENSDAIYVISGGFEEYIRPTVKLLGLNDLNVFANKFLFDSENIIGYDTNRPTAMAGGKPVQVRELGLTGRVIAIGDGYTDYQIKESGAADEFWAFTETVDRENVTRVADKIIASFDEVASLG